MDDKERLKVAIYEVLLAHERQMTEARDEAWSAAVQHHCADPEEKLDRVIHWTLMEGMKSGSDMLTRKLLDTLHNF